MSGYSGGEEDLVDVEKRKRQAEYTLGDPLLFPLEFINWLKRYIEQSGIQIPASQIFGLPSGGGAGSLKNFPPGLTFPFAGPIAPEGSLPCDGQELLIADYPELAAQLGNTWGIGTATTFFLPDLQDRALYGRGPQMPVGMTDQRAVGSRGPWHHHTINIASAAGSAHSHTGSTNSAGNHSHGMDGVGDHSHPMFGVGYGMQSVMQGTAGPLISVVGNIGSVSDNTGYGGGHGHGIHDGGSHVHTMALDAEAAHTHQVAGDTSGLGSADVGGFASVLYVITTG